MSRLHHQTSRNKNNFPLSLLPRLSPSPLFLPLIPPIYLVPIQLPKLAFHYWPQLPNGPTALHGKMFDHDLRSKFAPDCIIGCFVLLQVDKSRQIAYLRETSTAFCQHITPATIQLAPSPTWNKFPTNAIFPASRSTTILISSQPHNSNPSTVSNHGIYWNISTNS